MINLSNDLIEDFNKSFINLYKDLKPYKQQLKESIEIQANKNNINKIILIEYLLNNFKEELKDDRNR